VTLIGKLVGGIARLPGIGFRFSLRDVADTRPERVKVDYRGRIPDMVGVGSFIGVTGRIRNGVFIALPDSLVTKIPPPGDYSPVKSAG